MSIHLFIQNTNENMEDNHTLNNLLQLVLASNDLDLIDNY